MLKSFRSHDFCDVFILYYEYMDLATSSYEQIMIVYLLSNNKISSRFGFYQVLKYASCSLQLFILHQGYVL